MTLLARPRATRDVLAELDASLDRLTAAANGMASDSSDVRTRSTSLMGEILGPEGTVRRTSRALVAVSRAGAARTHDYECDVTEAALNALLGGTFKFDTRSSEASLRPTGPTVVRWLDVDGRLDADSCVVDVPLEVKMAGGTGQTLVMRVHAGFAVSRTVAALGLIQKAVPVFLDPAESLARVSPFKDLPVKTRRELRTDLAAAVRKSLASPSEPLPSFRLGSKDLAMAPHNYVLDVDLKLVARALPPRRAALQLAARVPEGYSKQSRLKREHVTSALTAMLPPEMGTVTDLRYETGMMRLFAHLHREHTEKHSLGPVEVVVTTVVDVDVQFSLTLTERPSRVLCIDGTLVGDPSAIADTAAISMKNPAPGFDLIVVAAAKPRLIAALLSNAKFSHELVDLRPTGITRVRGAIERFGIVVATTEKA